MEHLAFCQNFPFFTIIMTLSSGVICSILKPKKAMYFQCIVIFATFVMSLITLLFTLSTKTSYAFMMGHFPAPWGNELRIGPFESLMATCFSGIMLLSLIGGMSHIFEDTEEKKTNLYFCMISLLLSSLFALIYTNDIFTGYVFVEINTITSCAIVMLKYRGGKTIVATTRYMVMSLLGSGLFLLGITMLYDLTGHLLMPQLGQAVNLLVESNQYMFPLTVIIGLFSIGLSIKSALFPFHTWLPDAHGNATASSSAILSGLVLKGYIILLIKIFYRVIGLDVIEVDQVTNILFVFGILAMIIGSIKAISQQDIKKMLAYSSVAQIGYVYLGIGLGTNLGIIAASLQILAHAFTKPMLFVCSGGLMDVSGGSKQAKDLSGAGYRDKLTGVAFTIGGLSMVGIPLLAGFSTKFNLCMAAIEYGNIKMIMALIAIIISTVLNAMYYLPAIFNLYHVRHDDSFKDVKAHYHFSYAIVLVIFILLNFSIGIFSDTYESIISMGLSTFG
ncbi:MAG: proton-conducting transporter membrane subunit [Eubacteriales bacterium]|nr:proton-conducting transporter membrane subunit [Eubacteriales bacterium]